jgi:hypothetical protein
MHGGGDVAADSDVLAHRTRLRTDSIKPSHPPTLGRAGLRCCPTGHAATAGFAEMRPLLTHKRRIPSASKSGECQMGALFERRPVATRRVGTNGFLRLALRCARAMKRPTAGRLPVGFAVRAQADCDGA